MKDCSDCQDEKIKRQQLKRERLLGVIAAADYVAGFRMDAFTDGKALRDAILDKFNITPKVKAEIRRKTKA